MSIPVHVKIKKKDWNMDILVIGNGFDLAHELKTTYKDFLLACQNDKLPDGFKNFCKTNVWLKHFITSNANSNEKFGETWIDLEKEIFKVIDHINKVIFWTMDEPYSNCKSLKIFKRDFYFNFFNIGDNLQDDRNHQDFGQQGYIITYQNSEDCKIIYFRNLKGFINFLYDQLREFTYAFEYYLDKIVLSNLNTESQYIISLQSGCKSLSVLSFNYTDTCERLYRKDFAIKPYYVHGKINCSKNTCKLVLGTHSFDNKPQNEKPRSAIPYEFNVFRKHNQRHKYGTIEAYQELLKELTDHRKVIKPVFHVIGHSLDETDKNILKHLFLINKNAIINIYYHDEEAQERLINNITDIIGEEEVMMRVRLIYQHDENRGILKHRD